MEHIDCINFRECNNEIYTDESEYNHFQEKLKTIEGFVLPRRCRPCRAKAKVWFEERKRAEAEAEAREKGFVVGSNDFKKFPHSRGGYNSGANDYGVK